MNVRLFSICSCARFLLVVALLLIAPGFACAGEEPRKPTTAPPAELTLTIVPEAAAADGAIPAVQVRLHVAPVKLSAGEALLALPLVVDNAETVAKTIEKMTASDALGAIPLTVRDRIAQNGDAKDVNSRREWIAGRAVEGAVEAHWRAPITNLPNALGAAPPMELRSEGGGFSGLLASFVALPADSAAYRVHLRWDFSALRQDAAGLSSLGVGDLDTATPLTTETLGAVYLFGGHLGRYPAQPTAEGFFSAWQGAPPFDAQALMQWTERLYRSYLGFFRPRKLEPYAVLLRRNPINAGGGVELGNAFIGTFDTEADTAPFKETLAHEMVHTFVHGLDAEGAFGGTWYSEGLAVYYERELPLRAGAFDAEAFLRDLNSTAARYSTDALAATPESQVDALFWADTRVRVLPYDRGSLYFATVDSAMRQASGGRRSLDDLVLEMVARRGRGEPVNEAAWRTQLEKNLGAEAVRAFEAMLRGDPVLPASDAFGPCFRRTTKQLRRYESGFEPRVLSEPSRIVRGLVAGSAAEKAGLRNGDHITRPVPQDMIQADQTAELTLQIERAGKSLTIRYLPRGEQVEAYQWERVADVPESHCALPATGAATQK